MSVVSASAAISTTIQVCEGAWRLTRLSSFWPADGFSLLEANSEVYGLLTSFRRVRPYDDLIGNLSA